MYVLAAESVLFLQVGGPTCVDICVYVYACVCVCVCLSAYACVCASFVRVCVVAAESVCFLQVGWELTYNYARLAAGAPRCRSVHLTLE